jgi:hypothetical protein
MTRKIGYLSILILLFTGFTSSAQTFSADKAKLFAELKEIFVYNDKDQGKIYTAKMEKELKDNFIGADRVVLMQEMYTELVKKKYRVYPFYSNYFDAVLAASEKGRPDAEFKAWHKALLYVLKKKPQATASDFIEFSQKLFANNVIYESISTKWMVYGAYTLQYEEGKEPTVVFPNVTLVTYSRNDSALIYNTSGRWIMTENNWVGKGGTVYWERAGLAKDFVNAQLKNYKIALKSSDYKADSVEFIHNRYFTKPILGALEEKVLNNVTPENASYPRFKGYDKRVKLDNLAKDVNYLGGFQFNGNKFIGSGDAENPALIIFNKNDKPFIKIGSLNYSFRENVISSENAEVTIYIIKNDTTDSIYQPGLNFKYLTDKKELSLLRLGDGLQKSLYLNTFHNIDMDVEAIYWKTNEDKIEMSSIKGSSEGRANFTSASYFRDMLYERLDGIGDQSPLLLLKQFYNKNPERRTFTGKETAAQLRDDPSQVRQFLMMMSIYGLVAYNVDRDEYVVKDRFFQIVNSRSRLVDYDVIEFNSVIKEKNATLSLLDYNMKMRGVGRILLSDSQQVVIYPHDQELLMKKDMDFSFDGTITAGRFTFLGKIYDFYYDKFKINLASVDSIKLKVKRTKPDENGAYSNVNVKTAIHDVTGELFIDAPGNKSGIKSLGRYPIFDSKKPSYTYYDGKSVAGGVYKRDNFYFQIDPFVIDSLDVFPTENLLLDGTFSSADIFPDIKDKLRVMPDYSLGIHHVTPAGGYPAYGGPAKYSNEIKLSHDGLRGNGTLEYLTAKTESNDFKFYPDSMNALAQKFRVEKTTGTNGTPDVTADSVDIHWEPKNGMYNVKNLGPAFKMYGGQAKLDGRLTVTDNGIKGGGLIDLGNAELISKNYDFKTDKFLSDTADFKLRDIDPTTGDSGIAFNTKNMKTEIDFKLRKGKFEANDENAYVDFPINKYRGFTDKLDWDMDKNDIELRVKKGNEKEGFRFVSTRPDQDSLRFNAEYALFKASDKVIYSEKVKHIDIADSRVMLGDGKVVIRHNAAMDSLYNTTILMPAEKPFHTLKRGTVGITGRNKIGGYAIYEYKDKTGRVQDIHMSTILVDSIKQMRAKGNITAADSLKFMPNVSFKGDFNLYSKNPEPFVKGYITLDHDCPLLSKKWMETEGFIGDGDIMIPVPAEARDEQKNIMFNGFAFASDSSGIYPVLISGKKNYSDQEVVSASGFLAYNATNGEYRVATKEKLANPDAEGNVMVFKPADCSAYGEGKLDLGGKLGQVKTFSAGRINYLPADTTTELDVVFGIDFFLESSIWELINTKIKDHASGTTALSTESTLKDLGELINDKKDRAKFIGRTSTSDKLPAELAKTLMFTDVHLFWNKKTRSLQHSGPVGILSLNGKLYNRSANMKMEITRKRSGDAIQIYIEFDSNNWYYFNYRNNIMQVLTSHTTEINNKILELDAGKRSVEGKNGIPTYQFTLLVGKRQFEQWLEKF